MDPLEMKFLSELSLREDGLRPPSDVNKMKDYSKYEQDRREEARAVEASPLVQWARRTLGPENAGGQAGGTEGLLVQRQHRRGG